MNCTARFMAFLFLASMPLLAGTKWVEVRSSHFTVLTNGGARQGREIAKRFEQMRLTFETLFTGVRTDPGKPFIIIAGSNRKSLAEFVPSFRKVPKQKTVAGIFVPTQTRYFAVIDLQYPGYGIINHEYVHMINQLNYAHLPLWLNEGFAEYFENLEVTGSRINIGAPRSNHLTLLSRFRPIPMDSFLATTHDSPNYNERNRVNIFYAQCWAFTHYLHNDAKAREQNLIGKFTSGMQRRLPVKLVTRQAFGDVKELDKSLRDYIKKRRFTYFPVKRKIKVDSKSFSKRTLEEAEILTWKGLFLAACREAEAASFLERAIALDPGMSLAHEGLGILHFSSQAAASSKHLQRALELDPDAAIAHYLLASLLARNYDLTQQDRALIETHLKRVTQLNPNFAAAYADLGELYARMEEDKDTALGLIGKAIQLEAGNLNHRFTMVRALNRFGSYKSSVTLLQRMLNLTDSSRTKKKILFLLEKANGFLHREN